MHTCARACLRLKALGKAPPAARTSAYPPCLLVQALSKAPPADEPEARCRALLDAVTFSCFAYVTRGLFERHRLIFSSQARRLSPLLIPPLAPFPLFLGHLRHPR